MDKTLEIIIAATVILLTALTVIFMVGGQSGDFQNWMNNTQGDAECSLKQTQYENACDCGAGNPNTPESEDIISSTPDSCEWTDDASCSGACS